MSNKDFFMPYKCEICLYNSPFNSCSICKRYICIKCMKFQEYCVSCTINKESSLIIIKNVNKNKRNKFIKKYFCCFNKIKPI